MSDSPENQSSRDVSSKDLSSGNVNTVTPPLRDAEITVEELKVALDKNENIFLLDVRSLGEYQAGHVAEVDILIPHTDVLQRLEELPSDKNKYIYCICRSGRRSAYVTTALITLGYTNTYNVIGGMIEWSGTGYPVESVQE